MQRRLFVETNLPQPGTRSWLTAIGDNVDYTHVCLETHVRIRLRRFPGELEEFGYPNPHRAR
ncbi:hypothetical protein GA0070613_5042 [Micromonospora inositola]|uniref:Uncharacterized protein n=1 Tax=Micromonospora inositola TaxID=47865 RepID=A0A1C5JQE5_9ACTN|nr:hypothetical protein GA0070613_5042 [Micromonospora inositola]